MAYNQSDFVAKLEKQDQHVFEVAPDFVVGISWQFDDLPYEMGDQETEPPDEVLYYIATLYFRGNEVSTDSCGGIGDPDREYIQELEREAIGELMATMDKSLTMAIADHMAITSTYRQAQYTIRHGGAFVFETTWRYAERAGVWLTPSDTDYDWRADTNDYPREIDTSCEITPVIMRVDNDGFVFAILPELPATLDGDVTIFTDTGHTAGPYELNMSQSRPAYSREYANLLQDLRRIGYPCPIVVGERTTAMLDLFNAELYRLRNIH